MKSVDQADKNELNCSELDKLRLALLLEENDEMLSRLEGLKQEYDLLVGQLVSVQSYTNQFYRRNQELLASIPDASQLPINHTLVRIIRRYCRR